MNTCQHCDSQYKGTGAVFEICCPDCFEKGHRSFKAWCPICNPPKPPKLSDADCEDYENRKYKKAA